MTVNDIKLSITANIDAAGVLREDMDYIESKFMHSRYAESSAQGTLSTDVAKVYESARTMMYISRLLMNIATIRRIDMEGQIGEQTLTCDLYIAHGAEEVIVTLRYRHSANYVYKIVVKRDGTVLKELEYLPDPSGIMSYDMNFPPPSTFLRQMQDIINN